MGLVNAMLSTALILRLMVALLTYVKLVVWGQNGCLENVVVRLTVFKMMLTMNSSAVMTTFDMLTRKTF